MAGWFARYMMVAAAGVAGLGALAPAYGQDRAVSARLAVDTFMQGRTLDVVIERRPVACSPSSEVCYSNYFRKLRWVQDDAPRLSCRSAMLPAKRRVSYRLVDEGEPPFAPAAVFARIADPQDAWIDWRAVTRIVREDRVVRVLAPLNAYRVNFTFAKTADSARAAERLEALRSACADPEAPVTDLLQAYRVSLKTLQESATGLRVKLPRDAVPDAAQSNVAIAYLRGGMCEGGSLGGVSDGKRFTIAFPDLRNGSVVSREADIVRIDATVAGYVVEFDLKTEQSAATLADAVGFIANWCRTQYVPTKIYPRMW